jgi:hypothetical protein
MSDIQRSNSEVMEDSFQNALEKTDNSFLLDTSELALDDNHKLKSKSRDYFSGTRCKHATMMISHA